MDFRVKNLFVIAGKAVDKRLWLLVVLFILIGNDPQHYGTMKGLRRKGRRYQNRTPVCLVNIFNLKKYGCLCSSQNSGNSNVFV